MRVLVTGATGKVGNAIVHASAARGDEVRALVRDPAKAVALLPEGAEPVRGDVTDPASLDSACAGCELVFNAMGLPEQWFADPGIFERVNAVGSDAVVRAAARGGVRRVVHTSTIDVFHAERGARFDETRVADYPKGTAYERSKQRAEELVLAAARDTGIELVIANPAAVYGPGPEGSASLEQALMAPVIEGRRSDVPALPPGGFGVVFNEGAAQGHLLVAERGIPGERYILCDTHVTVRQLVETAVRIAGRGKVPPTMPAPIAKALTIVGEPIAKLTRTDPLMAKGELHFLLWNAAPDSSKAQRELGWQPTPLEAGMRETLAALDLL